MFRLVADTIEGSAGALSIAIDAQTGAIRNITNTATGQSLVDAPQAAPWRMTPQGGPSMLPPHVAARYKGPELLPAAFSFEIAASGEEAMLRWTTTDPGTRVVVRARFAGGALELWPRIEVDAGSSPPVRFSYPVLQRPRPLSADQAGDRLVFPAQSGWVIRNPLAWRPMSAFYPDGFDGASVQVMAYYAEDAGGFYIACHDPHSTCKQIRFSAAEAGFDHETWDLRRGTPVEYDYPIVIAPLLRGDWHEAVERYRAWALEHAPWAKGGTPNAARAELDGARWLREEVGMSIWGTPSSLDWSPWYRMYADELGMPLHIVPGWDWAAELPPTRGREGWFPARFHENNVKAWAGHRVTPYMNDLFISPRSEGFFEEWEPNLIFPYQTFNWTVFAEPPPGWIDGEAPGPSPHTSGVELFMCPATGAQAELHAWRDATLARDYGCDGACYDISSGNPRLGSRCLRAEHGHPPGRGRAIIEEYDRVNMRSKEQAHAETGRYFAQGVETICETVVGSVDFYVARACAGPLGALEAWFVGPEDALGGTRERPGGTRELIPLFQAIYHDVGPVHEDGWLTMSAEQGELFYWIAGRIYLQWGGLLSLHYATNPPESVPGHDGPAELIHWNGSRQTFNELPEFDHAKMAFVRELAQARTGFGRDLLAYGRILRPVPFDTGTIELPYSQRLHTQKNLRNEGVWTTDAVMHAAWASTSGAVGLFFVNLRADGVEKVNLDVDAEALWGLDFDGRTVAVVTTEGETPRGKVAGGRLKIDLALKPRQVTLVELR